MSLIIIALVVLLLLFVVGVLASKRAGQSPELGTQAQYDAHERSRMPQEIAHGRLVASEKWMCTDTPAGLEARIDQMYETQARELILVETKNRRHHGPYLADVIELSVQAVIVAARTGRRVARGYVRTVRQGTDVRYHLIELIDEAKVCSLRERYLSLLEGSVSPRPAARRALCRTCGYAKRCPAMRSPT